MNSETIISSFNQNRNLDSSLSSSSNQSGSDISEFYRDKSVFLTGGTGFVGKVLIEKLLRGFPQLNRIFVLIKPKWDKGPQERLIELLQSPLFDVVRKIGIKLEDKVVAVEGDVTLPHLGLSEQDLTKIIGEVSIIYHSAATVRFDEPLKQSIAINLIGTKNIIELCRKISQLAALVHVSTAYANCDQKEIDEHVYPVDLDPELAIKLHDLLNPEQFQELKRKLLGKKPNTYTYTKALAEWLLIKCARDLPVVICRPSIVVSSYKEPIAGWVDNANGPTGIYLTIGVGLVRTMYGKDACVSDVIPVDTVINLMIILSWFANLYGNHKRSLVYNEGLPKSTITKVSSNGEVSDDWRFVKNASMNEFELLERSNSGKNSDKFQPSDTSNQHLLRSSNTKGLSSLELKEHAAFQHKLKRFRQNTQTKLLSKGLCESLADIPVFHCTSGSDNPITWARLYILTKFYLIKYPTTKMLRYPRFAFAEDKRSLHFYRLILHYIPAYVIDFFRKLFGRKQMFVKQFKKFDQIATILETFTAGEWKFNTDNEAMLMKEFLSEKDQTLLDIDVGSIDWNDFLEKYVLGIRKFMFKEPISNLEQARRNLQLVYCRNFIPQAIIFIMFMYYFFILR